MSEIVGRLAWGQTPWDTMSREELLREMQRAYAAATAARSVLVLLRGPETSGFWGATGSGHRALEKCRLVTAPIEANFNRENVYRAFFRYADDLLFSPELGCAWRICARGTMLGSGDVRRPVTTCVCCNGPMRPIEWGDITPKDVPPAPNVEAKGD